MTHKIGSWTTRLALAGTLLTGAGASARDLEAILLDKGVISEPEAAESRTSAPKGTALQAYWDNGIRLSSADGQFKLKVGGRIMSDWAYFDEGSAINSFFNSDPAETVSFGDGTEFRRLRLYFAGTVYKRVIFKAQYDFAGGDAAVRDMYIGLTKLPVLGELKVGNFHEPFSLEELTSSKHITFLERSLPTAFAPSRHVGIGFQNAVFDKRMTYALGVFRGDSDGFGSSFGDDDSQALTLRVTGLPWKADDGLLHLGFAYSHRTADGGRFRARPEAHLSPVRFVDTGSFDTEDTNLVGFEAATVVGPISVQGEYIGAYTDAADFGGYYVFATLFLTGEQRGYKTSSGKFDRVKPAANFLDGKGGLGAWEAGIRYSALDLTDGSIAGGELGDLTVGLNWYLNPNTRVMFNYVYADLDGVGEANVVQARFQIDF